MVEGLNGSIGKKVAEGKIEICDFKHPPAVLRSFKLLGLDEKVNDCGAPKSGRNSVAGPNADLMA
jgi:hypothetical protein